MKHRRGRTTDFLCKVFGHQWKIIWPGKTKPFSRCERCGEEE